MLDAFRAAVVFRVLEAAAFLPAATRFGDFFAVVRFRPVEAFFAAEVLRFRVAAAFFPAVFLTAVFRFRVAAAFLAAVFLERDVVAFRPVVPVRLRVAAAFFPAATRFGDFLVVRFRVAPAFFAAVFRERVVAAFFAAVLRLRVVAAFFAAVLRVVVVRLGRSIGAGDVIGVLSGRGVGRSHAGVAGCHAGSGLAGPSIVLRSTAPPTSRICSASDGSSLSVLGSSHCRSCVLRSGMLLLPSILIEVSPPPTPTNRKACASVPPRTMRER